MFREKIASQAVKEVLEHHEEKMYSKEELAEKFNVSSTTLCKENFLVFMPQQTLRHSIEVEQPLNPFSKELLEDTLRSI